jgi:hypothetical protein
MGARILPRATRLVRAALAPAGIFVFAGVLALPLGAPRATAVSAIDGGPAPSSALQMPNSSPELEAAPPSEPAAAVESAIATDGPTAPPEPALAPRGDVVVASWYGPGFYGNRLPCWRWLQANGSPIALSSETWGVAHQTLPCGTRLVLSYGERTVTVPVVDRGPYVAGRTLDLSAAVRAALGCPPLCTLLMHIDD